MTQHHLVRLAAETRLFVAAECRMRGIEMVAVGPHTSGLHLTAHTVCGVANARPYGGAQSVHSVVRDFDRVLNRLELRDGNHGTENLLLEHAHLVMTDEDSRLNVVAVFEVVRQVRLFAAGGTEGAFLLADFDVFE